MYHINISISNWGKLNKPLSYLGFEISEVSGFPVFNSMKLQIYKFKFFKFLDWKLRLQHKRGTQDIPCWRYRYLPVDCNNLHKECILYIYD